MKEIQEFQTPPFKLRRIRNDYEHFEEKLDDWATNSKTNIYIDLNIVSPGINFFPGAEDNVFRQLEGYNLTFWNNSVNLQEVIQWVSETSSLINENSNEV